MTIQVGGTRGECTCSTDIGDCPVHDVRADKVESRTEHAIICDAVSFMNQGETGKAHDLLRQWLVKYADNNTTEPSPDADDDFEGCNERPEATRPSVPQQGQALADTVESLLATLRCDNPVKTPLPNPEGYREKNLLNDCGNCRYCKVVAALAASRSEEATVRFHDFLPCNQFVRLVREMFIAIHDGIELAEDKKREWLKLLNESAGAPAAGSTEWKQEEETVRQQQTKGGRCRVCKGFTTYARQNSKTGLCMGCETALAGTDTDVAKEKL